MHGRGFRTSTETLANWIGTKPVDRHFHRIAMTAPVKLFAGCVAPRAGAGG